MRSDVRSPCTGHAIEGYCEGRRPIGHVELAAGGSGLAAHLARSAHLEAASVVAFEQLAARLAGWGAPPALVDRCRRAAAEEVVHAERLGALARREGAAVPAALHRPCDQRAAIARLPALARAQAAGVPAILGLPDAGGSASLSARFAAGLADAA